MYFYTHKLTLHSYRQFRYEGIVDVKQYGEYVVIAERYKVTRVWLGNFGEMAVKLFS